MLSTKSPARNLPLTLKFTATEQRILDLLSDGFRHDRYELYRCLDDDQAGPTALRFHIYNIRKKLNTIGESVICEARGYQYGYRHVRLLRSACDGKT